MHLRIHCIKTNKESGLLNRCITRIHHTQSNKESCLWNRCVSGIHHTTANKESCLLNRCISRTHHTTANKESCLLDRCISRTHHTGTDTSHRTPQSPEGRRRCRLVVRVRQVDRGRSCSFPRFWHRRRSVGTTAPEESGEGQWPGSGLRWSVDVHWLLVAAQQWCGGYHPSQSVVTAPGRRHRHHLHPRDLGRSPGISPFSYSSV